jgi:hypothetical protein
MGKTYRILKPTEYVQHKDEHADSDGVWTPVDRFCSVMGKEAGTSTVYRRPGPAIEVTKEQLTGQLERLCVAVELMVKMGGKESIILRIQRKNSRKLLDTLTETK